MASNDMAQNLRHLRSDVIHVARLDESCSHSFRKVVGDGVEFFADTSEMFNPKLIPLTSFEGKTFFNDEAGLLEEAKAVFDDLIHLDELE